jgi:hypothetical protein
MKLKISIRTNPAYAGDYAADTCEGICNLHGSFAVKINSDSLKSQPAS